MMSWCHDVIVFWCLLPYVVIGPSGQTKVPGEEESAWWHCVLMPWCYSVMGSCHALLCHRSFGTNESAWWRWVGMLAWCHDIRLLWYHGILVMLYWYVIDIMDKEGCYTRCLGAWGVSTTFCPVNKPGGDVFWHWLTGGNSFSIAHSLVVY